MPRKAVYSLTDEGEAEFKKLMKKISCQPVNIFLEFNSVIVNLENLSPAEQKFCLDNIGNNIKAFREELEEIYLYKKNLPEVSFENKAVLQQQLNLARGIETWIESLQESFKCMKGF